MSVLFGYLCGCATLVAIRLGWFCVEMRRQRDTAYGVMAEIIAENARQ